MPFFIIFICIPLLEIAVFMKVGQYIGVGTTLLLALITAILGGIIIKHQGLHLLEDFKKSLKDNKMPLNELFDGMCLIAAGATLITPGFVTDTIGFLFLLPAFRSLLRKIIKNHTQWATNIHAFGLQDRDNSSFQDPTIIEGEIIENTEDKEDSLKTDKNKN